MTCSTTATGAAGVVLLGDSLVEGVTAAGIS